MQFKVIETFEIGGRGTVVVLDNQADTSNRVGKGLPVTLHVGFSTKVEVIAYKEWLLRRTPTASETEAYLLSNVSKSSVPVGTTVFFNGPETT